MESWGHQAFVFTFGNGDRYGDRPNIIRSPALPVPQNGYHLAFRSSRYARKLAKTMDVFHVHHPLLIGPEALSIARRLGIPVVFTNHTRYDLVVNKRYPLLPKTLPTSLVKAYIPHFASQCDLVVVPSRPVSTWLRDLGVNTPIEVIPNGVDTELYSHPTAPLDKADLGLPEGACVAITVGRVDREKNLSFLLRAFRQIARKIPGLHLVVVGDGPDRRRLVNMSRRAELSDRIHLIGAVPYADVPNWLALADFFVITSTVESHPLAVLEALAAGLPVVGIAAPGVQDSVQDNDNGLLSPEKVDAFGQQMARLAVDADLRNRLARRACEIGRRFDFHRTSTQLLAHYERLTEERQRRLPGVSCASTG